ncbi:MAG: hypothetical protein ACREMO_13905 [Gemmatimonadales bacterium]
MSDLCCPPPEPRRNRTISRIGSAGFGLAFVTLLTGGWQSLSAQSRLSGTLQVSALVADSQSVWGGVSGAQQAIRSWQQGTTPGPQNLTSSVQITLVASPLDLDQEQFLLVTVEYLKN